MFQETQIVVGVYHSLVDAQIDQSLLENAGIWSMIRNEYMASIYPIGALDAELVVCAEDVVRAREVLSRRR